MPATPKSPKSPKSPKPSMRRSQSEPQSGRQTIGSAGKEVKSKPKKFVDEPVPDKLVAMLRRAADFEKQSRELSREFSQSSQSRLTQSCTAFRSMSSMASSKLSRAVSLRQQTNRILAARGRHSPLASHGKYRVGQLSKLGSGMFHLPEIPGTPGQKEIKDAKSPSNSPKRKPRRRNDGPQEVSLEAARAFWDLAAAQEGLGRRHHHRSSHEEDRAKSHHHATPSARENREGYLGVPELAFRVGLPQQVAKEAAHLFKRFAEFPNGGNIFDGRLPISRLTDVLVALCDVSDASELDKKFAERASRAADRDSRGFMGVEEFAIWYSSFCFAEEVSVEPQVRQTRELARFMGLEIWAIEKFRVAFDKYDADGSGEIEFDEFSDMVQELLKIPSGHELPYDRLMTMWRTADMNQKGFLDFREFCFFYVRMASMDEGCDPIRDYYRNVRSVPVAPL